MSYKKAVYRPFRDQKLDIAAIHDERMSPTGKMEGPCRDLSNVSMIMVVWKNVV